MTESILICSSISPSADHILYWCHNGDQRKLLVLCSKRERTKGCVRDFYPYGQWRFRDASDVTFFDRAAHWTRQGK